MVKKHDPGTEQLNDDACRHTGTTCDDPKLRCNSNSTLVMVTFFMG